MQFTICFELIAPPGQDFMSIGLMTNVPDDTVFRSIKHIMKGYRQFYHAQARSQMAGINRQFLHNILTQLIAQLRQLVDTEFSEVFRKVYATKQFKLFSFFHNGQELVDTHLRRQRSTLCREVVERHGEDKGAITGNRAVARRPVT